MMTSGVGCGGWLHAADGLLASRSIPPGEHNPRRHPLQEVRRCRGTDRPGAPDQDLKKHRERMSNQNTFRYTKKVSRTESANVKLLYLLLQLNSNCKSALRHNGLGGSSGLGYGRRRTHRAPRGWTTRGLERSDR